MSYAGRVPHPLDDPKAKSWPLWAWALIVAGVVVLVYGWRAGWFQTAAGGVAKAASGPPNPFGWR